MKTRTLKKRCPQCEEQFTIPNVRESRARNLIIKYFPCSFCGYREHVIYPRYNKQGHCRDCFMPFCLVKHQAKGRCNRCYMEHLRHEKRAKLYTPENAERLHQGAGGGSGQ